MKIVTIAQNYKQGLAKMFWFQHEKSFIYFFSFLWNAIDWPKSKTTTHQQGSYSKLFVLSIQRKWYQQVMQVNKRKQNIKPDNILQKRLIHKKLSKVK